MPKDRYGESLEVNDRVVLSKGGTGYTKMTMHKCIITRASKHTIWCYDYGPTSDGKELRCSVPQTRAVKIEHFGYGPDLIGVISEFITLGEMSWAEEDIDIRHKELAELMIKCITLFEEMKEEKE